MTMKTKLSDGRHKMTKKEFLRLNSLAWDYNQRHKETFVQIHQLAFDSDVIVTFLHAPDRSMGQLKVTNTLFSSWDMDKIMEELGK